MSLYEEKCVILSEQNEPKDPIIERKLEQQAKKVLTTKLGNTIMMTIKLGKTKGIIFHE